MEKVKTAGNAGLRVNVLKSFSQKGEKRKSLSVKIPSVVGGFHLICVFAGTVRAFAGG